MIKARETEKQIDRACSAQNPDMLPDFEDTKSNAPEIMEQSVSRHFNRGKKRDT